MGWVGGWVGGSRRGGVNHFQVTIHPSIHPPHPSLPFHTYRLLPKEVGGTLLLRWMKGGGGNNIESPPPPPPPLPLFSTSVLLPPKALLLLSVAAAVLFPRRLRGVPVHSKERRVRGSSFLSSLPLLLLLSSAAAAAGRVPGA